MNRWSTLALLLALACAWTLRVPRLALRPLHNDEAVNAFKATDLWQSGRYAYDPDEFHGPTLHYATLPALWLSPARNADEVSDGILRLAPVGFGLGLVALPFLFFAGPWRWAAIWAAFFTAVSPAMVFYSRYFIHEMLLVFFTALVLGAAERYRRSRSAVSAIVAGAGVGLMFATKETFVLSIAAMGFALAGFVCWRFPAGQRAAALRGWWNGSHAAWAIAAAGAVWLVFFSSFFSHFAGLADSVRTYLPWMKRAGGHATTHLHPWYFYLQRLAWFHPAKGPTWSEGGILIFSVIGAVTAIRRRFEALPRLLLLYTFFLTAIYCAISYKTPWCALSFFHGMILLAGLGAASALESSRRPLTRWVVGASILAVTLQLSWQAWCASFVYPADQRNPYVYAQTAPDLLTLAQKVIGITSVSPEGNQTIVKVVAPQSDYWPLPWYLRRCRRIGWYEKLPDEPLAPILIVSAKLNARLDEKSDHRWIMAGLAELRPGNYFELYVELELWKKYVASLPRDREDG